MYTLVKEKVGGPDDEHWRHRHDGLCYADGGVERGHEREAHTDEGAGDGGGEGKEHGTTICEGLAQLRCFAAGKSPECEADEARHSAYGG